MKKWFVFFALFIALVIGSFTFYLYLYRAEFTSTFLSKTLRIPLEIKNISYSGKTITLTDVTIYNPKECAVPAAFSTHTAAIIIDWKELASLLLSSRPTKIHEIRIDKPFFGIEFFDKTGSDSNWKRAIDHILNHEHASKEDKTFYVQHVVLNDVEATIYTHLNNGKIALSPTPHVSTQLAQIEMKQFSTTHPVTVRQIVCGIARLSLVQIGSSLNETDFVQSIKE